MTFRWTETASGLANHRGKDHRNLVLGIEYESWRTLRLRVHQVAPLTNKVVRSVTRSLGLGLLWTGMSHSTESSSRPPWPGHLVSHSARGVRPVIATRELTPPGCWQGEHLHRQEGNPKLERVEQTSRWRMIRQGKRMIGIHRQRPTRWYELRGRSRGRGRGQYPYVRQYLLL